jgi:D-alanine-D-alanine ligase
MEVNPLAGLHPQHSDLPIIASRLEIPYHRLIEWILASAAERVIPVGCLPAGKRRCA